MKDKTILITGGTGFVGVALQEYPPETDGCIYWVANRKVMKELLEQKYDYIIHLAPVSVDDVIECASKTDARILFASSGAVYGGRNKYADLKRESEEKLLSSGLDVRIARMFTFIGQGLPENLAPMQMLRAMQAGQPMLVGDAVRSYLDAEDMARWLWAILLDGEPGCVYDVGSDVPVTMTQLAAEIGKYRSGASWIHGDFPDVRKEYLPNIKPIQEALGVEITILFEQAVERFVKSYD
jgi:nucleoside-diphosphate-sugar epimerase